MVLIPTHDFQGKIDRPFTLSALQLAIMLLLLLLRVPRLPLQESRPAQERHGRWTVVMLCCCLSVCQEGQDDMRDCEQRRLLTDEQGVRALLVADFRAFARKWMQLFLFLADFR